MCGWRPCRAGRGDTRRERRARVDGGRAAIAPPQGFGVAITGRATVDLPADEYVVAVADGLHGSIRAAHEYECEYEYEYRTPSAGTKYAWLSMQDEGAGPVKTGRRTGRAPDGRTARVQREHASD